ncbi:MAG: thiamine phosphate synthase [Maricaulis sp.]|nr:thiamine phosphate synthase [Maricaulis sp.]
MLIRPPYALGSRLAISAERLFARVAGDLPRLWVLTDPARQTDPLDVFEHAPPGSGFIYRHFGAEDRLDVATELRAASLRRGITFLVSSDLDLVRTVGADGVHWPEHMLPAAYSARARGAGEIFTSSAHSEAAIHRASRAGIDAALVSSVFRSKSPSAGPPVTPGRVALLARRSPLPLIALGGVHKKTLGRLANRGLAGCAMVGGIRNVRTTQT